MLSLEIRCSEIASEAILGQKQIIGSYMPRGVLHPIFGCPCMQSENLRNLKIALHILRIPRLHSNLEITNYSCAISRLCNKSAQSSDFANYTCTL